MQKIARNNQNIYILLQSNYFMKISICKDTQQELEELCKDKYVLHGTKHVYEQDIIEKGKVFIPKNHQIFANKSPIHAMYHALFDKYKTKLQIHRIKGKIYSSVIVRELENAINKEGNIYIFSEEDFTKEGALYKQNLKRPLLNKLKTITVTLEDFKPPVYENNFRVIKEKTF